MKILFVHSYSATFTKIDLEILRSQHEVRELYIRKSQLKYLARDILRALYDVLWADVIFAWFGGYHAFIPFLFGRLLGRKCVVVASGYDVANMPDINYGNMRPGVRRIIGRLIFRLAHKVLAVSHFTAQEAIRNAKVDPSKVTTIYHGVTIPDFDKGRLQAKQNIAITVGVIDRERFLIKGLLNFIAAAKELPDIRFMLIGGCQDNSIVDLQKIASPNVEFTGPSYGSELLKYLESAKVYVQGSAYESFGIAVAEAMLCGCVPVVTNRGALPEVTGGLGFTVPHGDIKAMVSAIRSAIITSPQVGESCRMYIQRQFPLEKRKTELLQAIEQVFAE
jgi:glycosyltransferase involved in cell wall biosynthesis